MIILYKIAVACISTAAFSIIYHLRPMYILYSCLASLIACSVYLTLDAAGLGVFLPNFIATVFMVLFVEIISRTVKIPSSIIQMPGILPLIPGRALYYTMSYVLAEDYSNAFTSAMVLVKTALGIAIGITITSVCFRSLMSVINNNKKRKAS